MKNLNELDKYRVKHPFWPQTATSGAFKVFVKQRSFVVLAGIENTGDDGMMEHISVTPTNQKRCPTWDEMAAIKDMFFDSEEEAIQYFPKRSRYINIHEYCLHIWRPVNGQTLRKPGDIAPLESRDEALEKLWEQFGDVPMDPETECIEEPWLCFPAGTNREDIWHWFNERYSKGVAYLLYGGTEDYVPEARRLYGLKQLCVDCDAEHCAFNPEGVCLFPLVGGRSPDLNDNGCNDFCDKEDDL